MNEVRPIPQHRWHSDHPELGTGPIPAEPYYSQRAYELEVEHVFKKSWLFAGQLKELPEPGSFFVRDLPFANTSVLVVRDKNGEINAFHNICVHRGNRLAWDRRGKCNSFSCKFHGWTFDQQGKLRSLLDANGYPGLDRSETDLIPVSVGVWQEFIFINLAPQPEQTLSEYLGKWGEEATGFDYGRFPKLVVETAEVQANWKIVLDAFLETFHFGVLHRRTVGPAFLTPEHPLGKMHALHPIGIHGVMSTPGENTAYVPPPVLASVIGQMGRTAPRVAADSFGPGINPARVEDWVTDANFVFPNLNLHFWRNLYLTYSLWPVAQDRTIFELRYNFAEPTNASEAFGTEMQICDFRDVFLEDLSTNERTHDSLKSGVLKKIQVHDSELLVRHCSNTLRKMAYEKDGAKS